MLTDMLSYVRARPGRFVVAFVLLSAALASITWTSAHEPAIPAEYEQIRLGMKLIDVHAILASSGFQYPQGGGVGYEKRNEQTKECSELRWKDSRAFWKKYRQIGWINQPWALTITVDADDVVAGKSLVLRQTRMRVPAIIRVPYQWVLNLIWPPVPCNG